MSDPESKRALRRHHYERLKDKRQFYHGYPWERHFRDKNGYKWSGQLTYMTEVEKGITANTPQRCSCLCCGNPRKHIGVRTVQERRAGWPSPND